MWPQTPKYVPKYRSAKEIAESRARLRSRLLWTAAAVPLLFVFFAYGYSDQAPAALRNAVIAFDRALGFPIIWLLSLILG
jgi:hypothetical protein